MKKRSGLALVVGLAAASLAACGTRDDWPRPVYKYFGYVSNQGTLDVDGPVPGSGKISAFEIDPESGALTVLAGSPFAGAFQPTSLVAHPSGKYVYVTDMELFRGHYVAASAVDPSTGALTAVPGGSAEVIFPGSAGIDSLGRFIYVAGNHNLYAFAIDHSSGALAGVPGSPFAVGSPWSINVDPAGRFIYALIRDPESYLDSGLHAFAIDPASGALTEVAGSPFVAGTLGGLAVHSTGKFVYVTDTAQSRVIRFAIDAATGALTETVGSPFVTSDPPGQIEIGPSGEFAYIVNSGSDRISVYRIDFATGALSEISGSPFAAGTGIRHLTICPSGNFAFMLSTGAVAVLRIARDTGVLTEVPGSPLVIGFSPCQLAILRVAQPRPGLR